MNVELYLNGPDLASSTGIYMNADMTVCAPDGMYVQDGTVRQLLNCTLLPESACEGCAQVCGELVTVEDSAIGVYIMNIEVGAGTGAIIIRVNAQTIPKGFWALFNSTIYNAFSSPTYGYLSAPITEVTYLGDEYFDCGLVGDSPHTLQVYRWNGTTFEISTGETQAINVTAPQLQLTAADPGECVMVIPKLSATPSVVQMSIISACPPTDFDITVECVAERTGFASSLMSSSAVGACGLVVDQTYYTVPVNGDGTTLGLYDWVFSDINGQNPLSDGYYYAPIAVPDAYNYFQVENGVITDFDICPEDIVIGWEIREDQPGACVLNTYNLRLRVWRGVIPVLDQPGPATGNVASVTGTFLARFDISYTENTAACCDVEMVLEWDGVEIGTLNIGQPPIPPTVDAEVLQVGFVIAGSGTLRAFVRCA